MRTNRTVTLFQKQKTAEGTMFSPLGSFAAHVTGADTSAFEKGMTAQDGYIVRIPLGSVGTLAENIRKGDRVLLTEADEEALSGAALTDGGALTVVSIALNDSGSERVQHIKLECER